MATLVSKLSEARKKLGFTQQEFADLIGINLRTYVRYESPKSTREIPANVLQVFADKGISINWLFTGEGSMFIEKDGAPRDEENDDSNEENVPMPEKVDTEGYIVIERNNSTNNSTRILLPPTPASYDLVKQELAKSEYEVEEKRAAAH